MQHQGQLISDLTPVISNSGMYVDTHPSYAGTRPGMPGLPSEPSTNAEEEFMAIMDVGPPDNADAPRGGGRPSSQAAAGLRQRRMPLPRAGLPPAKRSSIEGVARAATSGVMPNAVVSTSMGGDAGGVASILRMPSSNATSEGGNLLGERLSMPSYDDESSSVDTSTSDSGARVAKTINNTVALGGATSIFKQSGTTSIFKQGGATSSIFKQNEHLSLAPIELKPDRKYFSFQGASQYKQRVTEAVAPPRLATIPSPSRRPPAPPSEEQRLPSSSSSALLPNPHHHNHPNATNQQRQYQPLLRSQHGVTEICDTKDLDAIFKAPRNANAPNVSAFEREYATLVSPYTPAASEGGVSMLVDHDQQEQMLVDHRQQPQPLPSYLARDEEDTTADHQQLHHLADPYPVDDRQWSIPSIRLANHIPSSNNGHCPLNDSFTSYADFSEYTDDDGASLDESYYSFLGDDDDTASMSSRGSVDAGARRRRISEMFQLQKKQDLMEAAAAEEEEAAAQGNGAMTSGVASGVLLENDGMAGPSIVSPPPAIAPSNSFLEKISGISIENSTAANGNATANATTTMIPPPTLTRRANTFDSEAPPPILNVNAPLATDDAAFEYSRSRRKQQHQSRHRSRRRRKEGAAVEWLQELQDRSSNASEGQGFLISEAASSKFLSVGGFVDGDAGIGESGGQQNMPSSSSRMTSEDVTKALGMPHPLCRSSTIEAGPFVNRMTGVFGSRNADSIALTSSGSGD